MLCWMTADGGYCRNRTGTSFPSGASFRLHYCAAVSAPFWSTPFIEWVGAKGKRSIAYARTFLYKNYLD